MLRPSIVLVLVTATALTLWFPNDAFSQPFVAGCAAPTFPTPAPTAVLGIDLNCSIQGSGGAEAGQNSAKNSFCASGAATPITIDEMKALQQKVESNKNINFGNTRDHPLSATAGPAKDRAPLRTLGEGTLKTLQGFVFAAHQEGKESVNCGTNVQNSALFHDVHVSIVADEGSTHGDECSSVVAEMSPHHRPDSWTAANVQRMAAKHRPVRVTGQLFFDSSHTPCQDGKEIPGDPRRASLWEIHPIYKFEICQSDPCTGPNSWIPLDKWVEQNR